MPLHHNRSLSFSYAPRPPGNNTLSTDMPRGRYLTIRNACIAKQHPAIARGSGTHELVIVTPHPGSVMAPAPGFDLSIASSLQCFSKVRPLLRSGLVSGSCDSVMGAVSGEETTDIPQPRVPFPAPLSHYTKVGGRASQGTAFLLAHMAVVLCIIP